MELTLENLKSTASELIEAAQGDPELQLLTEMAEQPKPEHRDGLIKIRDQALEQCAFEWAVLLSHFVYAMTEPAFWEGKEVKPSTL